jgi:hypothetical protein
MRKSTSLKYEPSLEGLYHHLQPQEARVSPNLQNCRHILPTDALSCQPTPYPAN